MNFRLCVFFLFKLNHLSDENIDLKLLFILRVTLDILFVTFHPFWWIFKEWFTLSNVKVMKWTVFFLNQLETYTNDYFMAISHFSNLVSNRLALVPLLSCISKNLVIRFFLQCWLIIFDALLIQIRFQIFFYLGTPLWTILCASFLCASFLCVHHQIFANDFSKIHEVSTFFMLSKSGNFKNENSQIHSFTITIAFYNKLWIWAIVFFKYIHKMDGCIIINNLFIEWGVWAVYILSNVRHCFFKVDVSFDGLKSSFNTSNFIW